MRCAITGLMLAVACGTSKAGSDSTQSTEDRDGGGDASAPDRPHTSSDSGLPPSPDGRPPPSSDARPRSPDRADASASLDASRDATDSAVRDAVSEPIPIGTPGEVRCGGDTCGDGCCICQDSQYSCSSSPCCAALTSHFSCDGPEDCTAPGERCCVAWSGATCCTSGDASPTRYDEPLCHTDTDCPSGAPHCCLKLAPRSQTPVQVFSTCRMQACSEVVECAVGGESYSTPFERECGLAADGAVALCTWRIAFGNDGTFQWSHSDVVESGTYSCSGGLIESDSGAQGYLQQGGILMWDRETYSRD